MEDLPIEYLLPLLLGIFVLLTWIAPAPCPNNQNKETEGKA